MKLRILTPEETVADLNVISVTLPSVSGEITAMQGHDSVLAVLKPGNIHCVRMDEHGDQVRDDFEAKQGFAEITAGSVIVCVSGVKAVK